MEDKVYIYVLKCPITNEVRYVGKSIQPKRRLTEHLTAKGKTHKHNWIKSLLQQELKPIMEIIEICTNETWEQAEKKWIEHYRNISNKLTNIADGGEGGRMAIEVRQRLSELNKGEKNPCFGRVWTDEERNKQSELLSNRSLSDEHKNNIGKSMKKRPIIIDGVIYESCYDASRILLIPQPTIYDRLKSIRFENYAYI